MPPVGDDQFRPLPGGLVLELVAQLAERRVRHVPGEAPVLDHPGGVEVLDHDRCATARQGRGVLVQELLGSRRSSCDTSQTSPAN